MRQLILAPHPPADAYLVLQREAAHKYLGGSLMSILLQTRFTASVVHEFSRHDFVPQPGVDVVLFRLVLRSKPLVSARDLPLFFDFVAYTYPRRKTGKLTIHDWLAMSRVKSQPRMRGSLAKWLHEQSQIPKSHRTRRDPDWRSYLVDK